jgi:hypothetical protein
MMKKEKEENEAIKESQLQYKAEQRMKRVQKRKRFDNLCRWDD